MSKKLDALLDEVRQLEKEMIGEARRKEAEFCYSVHAKAVEFTAAAKSRHRRLRLSIEYGDAEKYRVQLEVIRRSYQDIAAAGASKA